MLKINDISRNIDTNKISETFMAIDQKAPVSAIMLGMVEDWCKYYQSDVQTTCIYQGNPWDTNYKDVAPESIYIGSYRLPYSEFMVYAGRDNDDGGWLVMEVMRDTPPHNTHRTTHAVRLFDKKVIETLDYVEGLIKQKVAA